MAIDFFGVRLAGRIRQMGGGAVPDKTVELWTEPQESLFNKNLGALAFVSEVNIKYKLGDNADISLVLTPPFEDGLKFLQSDLIRFGTGRLEVEIGYTTGTFDGPGATKATQLPFTGFLQKPDVSIGSDIVITLHALGVGYQMNLVGGVEDTAFPADTTYSGAIELVLQKYVQHDGDSSGLKITDLYRYVDNKNTAFFKKPADKVVGGTKTKPDAEVVPGVIWRGPRNDWWFVRETLSEFGYDLFIHANEIFVVPKSFWFTNNFGRSGPRKQFMLRGNVDPTRSMYPILSFQSPTEAVWLQPGLGRIVSADADVNKKERAGKVETASADRTPIARGKESADPFSLISGVVGRIVDLVANVDFAKAGARMLPGDPNDPLAKAQAASHWTDLNFQGGLQGQFETIGVPDLAPGETVQVSGFEPYEGTGGDNDKALFNGTYGVIEVNHKVGVGGWTTSFMGIMNLYPLEFQEAVSRTLTPNLQTVAEDEDLQPESSSPSGGNKETVNASTQPVGK